MEGWHSSLLSEYREGKSQLNQMIKVLDDEIPEDKEDKRVLNSAIRDMDFVIEWLETGQFPEKNTLFKSHKHRVLTRSHKFVYGVDGYWDDSIGAIVDTNIYGDPYKEVEDKIDVEIERRRNEKSA